MKKVFAIASLTFVLAACNNSGSSDKPKADSVKTDTTVVKKDSTSAPKTDSTANKGTDTTKKTN